MSTDLVIPAEYNPVTDDWDTLSSEADVLVSAELVSGEAVTRLIGVPFIIVKVVYRDGIQRKGVKWRDDYVSCEAIVAPQDILEQRARMGRLDLAGLSVEPGEMIVFNDGSTGIYRQITQYLSVKGFITLPDPVVALGGKGDSSYDLPRSQWVSGYEQASTGIPVRFKCSKGIRSSEYTNEYTGDDGEAVTHYIA